MLGDKKYGVKFRVLAQAGSPPLPQVEGGSPRWRGASQGHSNANTPADGAKRPRGKKKAARNAVALK